MFETYSSRPPKTEPPLPALWISNMFKQQSYNNRSFFFFL